MPVNLLMEVLDACHNAEMEVDATVCDMAANNVMALKKLGVSEDTPFFSFRDQEIAAVFDPPYLLNPLPGLNVLKRSRFKCRLPALTQ
jgi:hypothetical protein